MSADVIISTMAWIISSYLGFVVLAYVFYRTRKSVRRLRGAEVSKATLIAARRNCLLALLLLAIDLTAVIVGTISGYYTLFEGIRSPEWATIVSRYVLVLGRVLSTVAGIVILWADIKLNR